MHLPRIDVEWVALRAGFKPAIRRAADPAEADEMEARLLRWGAKVVRASGFIGVASRPSVVLYAARAREHAEALSAVEAPMLVAAPKPMKLQLECSLEIGRLLGYPRCCVEAFCDRVERGVGVLRRGEKESAVEMYVSAFDAWAPRPSPVLNNLLLDAHVRFITFEPCRYDCVFAERLAAAVRGEVMKLDVRAARLIDEALSRSVVVTPAGARAMVVIERGGAPVISRAFVYRGEDGRALGAGDEALCAAVVGARVGEGGVVEGVGGAGAPPALCVDFGR